MSSISPPTPPPSAGADRRARRKAETRARLLAAARSLFVESGYHATRPQDIARAADVAVGTFYTYFEDKRDAFLAFTREVGDELLAELAGAWQPTDDFETGLGHVLEALMDYGERHPGVLAVTFADSVIASPDGDAPAEPSLRDRLASSLAEALRSGMKKQQLHGDYDADFVADAMVGLLHQGLVRADARPRSAVITNLTRFCRRALVRTAD